MLDEALHVKHEKKIKHEAFIPFIHNFLYLNAPSWVIINHQPSNNDSFNIHVLFRFSDPCNAPVNAAIIDRVRSTDTATPANIIRGMKLD